MKAFTRAPSLDHSKWYMGNLLTSLADKTDTDGAFCLVESIMARGNEPPPHVHSREDELFYVLDGAFDVYVGAEAFTVEAGGCVFLPRFKPHAFVIRSAELRLLTLFTPGGLEDAFRGMSSPAQRLERPQGAPTYATSQLQHVAHRLGEYGVQLLAAEEIAEQLLRYPKPLRACSSK